MVELELAYLGIPIIAGVINSNSKTLQNLRNENYGRPIFRATMYRFVAVSIFIRLDSAEVKRQQYYKLAPVRKLWELYFPDSNCTVDEQLVPFRGRCDFKQYTKPPTII